MADHLTVVHRQAQLAIRARMLRDLTRIWPAMDWTDLARTFPAWAAAVTPLIASYRATSSTLAAAYLRTLRAAQGIPGPAIVVLAGPVPAEQLAISRATGATSASRRAARASGSRRPASPAPRSSRPGSATGSA